MKLNSTGYGKGNPDQSGGGGVIRNEKWLHEGDYGKSFSHGTKENVFLENIFLKHKLISN